MRFSFFFHLVVFISGKRTLCRDDDHLCLLQLRAEVTRYSSTRKNENDSIQNKSQSENDANNSMDEYAMNVPANAIVLPRVQTGVSSNTGGTHFSLEHVYYINLDHRTDRKRQIEAEFAKHSINATRFSAFDAMDPANQDELKGCYEPIDVCRGSYGCWKSHYDLISFAIDQNLSHIAIFEDDFQFVDEWKTSHRVKDIIEKAISKLNDWDVVGLAFSLLDVPGSSMRFCDESLAALDENMHLMKIEKASAATGYIVNGRYLTTLRDVLSPEKCPVKQDRHRFRNDVCWQPLMKEDMWFAFDPQPGKQRHSFSNIEQESKNYDQAYDGVGFDVQCCYAPNMGCVKLPPS